MNSREIRLKRLLYQSNYRGSKEMDIFLSSFARKFLNGFSDSELDLYESLIALPDQDLYNWITGKYKMPEEFDNKVSKLIMNFKP